MSAAFGAGAGDSIPAITQGRRRRAHPDPQARLPPAELGRTGISAASPRNLRSASAALCPRRSERAQQTFDLDGRHAPPDTLWKSSGGTAGTRPRRAGSHDRQRDGAWHRQFIASGRVPGVAWRHDWSAWHGRRCDLSEGEPETIRRGRKARRADQRVSARVASRSGEFSGAQPDRRWNFAGRGGSTRGAVFGVANYRAPGDGVWPRSVWHPGQYHGRRQFRPQPVDQAGRKTGDVVGRRSRGAAYGGACRVVSGRGNYARRTSVLTSGRTLAPGEKHLRSAGRGRGSARG